MKHKRTDNKYWTGTRNFNHIKYESDLEDYIIDLENENQRLRCKHAVSGSVCFDKGYEQGYNDATKEACQEIAKNYQPKPNH